MHACNGALVLILTATAFMIIFHGEDWHFNIYFHTVCGAITLTCITFLGITGVMAIIARRKAPEVWQTSKILKKGRIHRFIAYTVLVLSQITILAGGCLRFYGKMRILFFVNTLFILTILIVGELQFRRTKKREDPFIEPDVIMTHCEFKRRIEEGEKLVILDEYVLDIS